MPGAKASIVRAVSGPASGIVCSLDPRPNFKLNLAAALAEWRSLLRIVCRWSAARERLFDRESPARSVKDVSLALGFDGPGRFAQYYKRTFGELPGERLQRSGTRGQCNGRTVFAGIRKPHLRTLC